MKRDVKTLDAQSAGSLELSETVFGIAEIRVDILQRMVKYQLARPRAAAM